MYLCSYPRENRQALGKTIGLAGNTFNTAQTSMQKQWWCFNFLKHCLCIPALLAGSGKAAAVSCGDSTGTYTPSEATALLWLKNTVNKKRENTIFHHLIDSVERKSFSQHQIPKPKSTRTILQDHNKDLSGLTSCPQWCPWEITKKEMKTRVTRTPVALEQSLESYQ